MIRAEKIIWSAILLSACISANPTLVAVVMIVFNFYLVIKVRQSRYCFFFFFLLFYFSLNFLFPLYISTRNVIYTNELYNTDIFFETLICYVLFMLSFYWCFNFRVLKRDFDLKFEDSGFVFYTLLILECIIAVFGINRSTASGYVVRITTPYELSYLVIFFCLLFSGKRKERLIMIGLVSLAVIIQDLLYDGRITSIQILLMYIMVFCKKISLKKLIPFGLICLIIFEVVGQARIGLSHEFNIIDNLFKIDTFYFAYQTSETHVYAYRLVDFNTRLTSFLGSFLKTFFIDLGGEYNVSSISYQYCQHYFGGYIFTWFYFWFGFLGPIIAGGLVALVLNYNMKRRRQLNSIILILAFATLPRWFVYEPAILFKFAIITPTIILFLIGLLKNMKSNRTVVKADRIRKS